MSFIHFRVTSLIRLRIFVKKKETVAIAGHNDRQNVMVTGRRKE